MEYIMSSKIQIMRLSTGEELICTVSTESTSSHGTVYHLTDIAILIPTEQNSLGLAPFVPYSTAPTKGVTIAEKDVMFVTEPVDDLRTQYQNMFSKVMTPQQNIVT
jgi:hypothetical protein